MENRWNRKTEEGKRRACIKCERGSFEHMKWTGGDMRIKLGGEIFNI